MSATEFADQAVWHTTKSMARRYSVSEKTIVRRKSSHPIWRPQGLHFRYPPEQVAILDGVMARRWTPDEAWARWQLIRKTIGDTSVKAPLVRRRRPRKESA